MTEGRIVTRFNVSLVAVKDLSAVMDLMEAITAEDSEWSITSDRRCEVEARGTASEAVATRDGIIRILSLWLRENAGVEVWFYEQDRPPSCMLRAPISEETV